MKEFLKNEIESSVYILELSRYDNKLTAEHVLEERASLVKIFASKVKA